MSISNHKTTMVTKWLAGSAFAVLALANCNAVQPKPQCKAQTGDYAAKYTKVEASAGCTDDNIITGEVLTLQYYSPAREGTDKPKLGVIPADLSGHLVAADEAGVEVSTDPDYRLCEGGVDPSEDAGCKRAGTPSTGAVGAFSSTFPDDKNVCTIKEVGTFSAKIDVIPKDPKDPMSEDTPAVDVKDTWTNLRMVVTPTSNAVFFGADLERTDGTCTVKYAVTAVSPVTNCEETKDTTEIDPDTMEPKKDPDTGKTLQVGTGKPDMSKCDPSDDNGLNVGISYVCDEHTFLCVPEYDYPKMK